MSVIRNQEFFDLVSDELLEIRNVLVAKNEAYGDAALNPIRIFSKADQVAGLKIRIDDKLSRLARGENAGEDVVVYLIGYLVFVRLAKRE